MRKLQHTTHIRKRIDAFSGFPLRESSSCHEAISLKPSRPTEGLPSDLHPAADFIAGLEQLASCLQPIFEQKPLPAQMFLRASSLRGA